MRTCTVAIVNVKCFSVSMHIYKLMFTIFIFQVFVLMLFLMLPCSCKRTKSSVIGVSVSMFVCVFVDTKISTLSEVGQHMSSTCNV